MTETTAPCPGKFVWRELLARDFEGAQRFYGELFGWKWVATPRMEGRPAYAQALLDDRHVAGLLDLGCDYPASNWVPYVAVEDVDQATETALTLGASVSMSPTDLPEVGRFAFLQDPQGAPFYLFRPQGAEGPETEPGVGAFAWEHLNTSDPAGGIAFYTKVAGWGTQDFGPVTFFTRENGTKPVAVVSQAPEGVPAHWLSYVKVESLAATNAKAKQLGAEVIEERIEVPGKGAFALLKDPDGALFMLSEPA